MFYLIFQAKSSNLEQYLRFKILLTSTKLFELMYKTLQWLPLTIIIFFIIISAILSGAVKSMSEQFKEWSKGSSGCDGVDLGGIRNRAVWVCGIEWGGENSAEVLSSRITEDVSSPPQGYPDWEENVAYIFNWQLMKLFAAMKGDNVLSYKSFAEKTQPFVHGGEGFFKMNLYPVAFKDTGHDRWQDDFSAITGFNSKADYIEWCQQNRFPQIRQWASTYKPKLVLCLGKSYLTDFIAAFSDHRDRINHEIIDDRDLYWQKNKDDTFIVVVPFMVNRYGLTKNTSIQKFGERISQITSAL